jgi:hypothetical protein
MTHPTNWEPDPDADVSDETNWDEYIARVRATSPDASPIVRECVQLWDHQHDDDGDCMLVPITGCGWWRPATEDEFGKSDVCPDCGGVSATRSILSLRDEVRARAVGAGVPTAIALAMTLTEAT